jgi:radical SAM protein with 4Fe4S-binding SPASM domain
MTNEEIDKGLIDQYLKNSVYGPWLNKTDTFSFKLEFIVSPECDQRCKYCYMCSNVKQPFPITDPKVIERNAVKSLDWVRQNNFRPSELVMFGGEVFSTELGFKVFELVAKNKDLFRNPMSLPTNGSFIFDEEKKRRVKKLLEGRTARVSFSVDGPFMEENRPLLSGKRDNKYYEDLFQFAKETDAGFHPMIYSEGVEHWKDNFLWFMEMFKKYDIPLQKLYLLEVRNWNWNLEQTGHYAEFLIFLLDWCKENIKAPLKDRLNVFNIFSNFFHTGRGWKCSFNMTHHLRLGDMAIVPCHRLMNDKFVSYWYNDDFSVKPGNVDFYILSKTMKAKNQPLCEACVLRHICIYGCMGSQFETTGDPFSPIPTVCRLSFVKLRTVARKLEEQGELAEFVSLFGTQDQRKAFQFFYKEVCK